LTVPRSAAGALPELERDENAAARQAFAADVKRGLSVRPYKIPPQYLYDDLGSSLFEAICHLPWYPITRAEKGLLRRHAPEVFARARRPLTIVELGCGTGEKLDLLLDAWDGTLDRLAVILIDISAAALRQSARLIAARGTVPVTCHHALYADGLARTAPGRSGARLVLFLGSNLGNFDPGEACEFLQTVRAALGPEDLLLLGVDLVKPASVLQLAYDDPLGVTAAFDRNLLARMNRDLDANFDLAAFEHRALWNAGEHRVEMHLVSRLRQTVTVPAADCAVSFLPGETLWTESSYKYTRPTIEQMLRSAGLAPAETWIDERAAFALLLARTTTP
jgi:dimethylhistidine N-methyltransferase